MTLRFPRTEREAFQSKGNPPLTPRRSASSAPFEGSDGLWRYTPIVYVLVTLLLLWVTLLLLWVTTK